MPLLLAAGVAAALVVAAMAAPMHSARSRLRSPPAETCGLREPLRSRLIDIRRAQSAWRTSAPMSALPQ